VKFNCSKPNPKVEQALAEVDLEANDYQVTFKTNHGDIRLKLYANKAPNHVLNLVGLAKSGFYDGLTFHRIVKDFVIQGGCPDGIGSGGPGYTIPAEFNDEPHEPGVLSMARTQDPNSAGSQFFLCLGRVTYLDGNYTVFGKTADEDSLKVVLEIGQVATNGESPANPVKIESTLVEATPR